MDQREIATAVEKIKKWALEAGVLQLRWFRNQKLDVSIKGGDISDLVTEADYESERFWIEKIHEAFPTHSIIAEESGSHLQEGSDYVWSIDPIDGTVNFAYGLPFFGSSIALKRGQEVLLGVIYIPGLQELYWATAGGGAYCNGSRLQVSSCATLPAALVATGFPRRGNTAFTASLQQCRQVTEQARDIRALGSAAYELCSVASGRLDAYWEMSLNAWDVDAGRLMVEEAGGTVALRWEGAKVSILASTPKIVPELQSIVKIIS